MMMEVMAAADETPVGVTPAPDVDLPVAFLKALHYGQPRPIASLLLRHRRQLDDLTHVLVRERLAVLACALLTRLKLRGLFPSAAWSLMEDQWRDQQQRNAEILRVLVTIEGVFREAGISWMYLKGLALGERYYGGADRRFTWDLDVLVRPADLPRVLDLLGLVGFSKPRVMLGMERLAHRVTHALECRRRDELSLDLHWTFRRLPGLRLDQEAVWRHSGHSTLGGVAIPVPSDEHALLQLLLGVTADLDRGLCRLRSLWDVFMMLETMPHQDWPSFLGRRQAEGALPLVANALALVVHGLDLADDCPALNQALEAHRSVLAIQGPADARRILARRPHGMANHFLYARWQPAPRRVYWSWWAATLPLRFLLARRL